MMNTRWFCIAIVISLTLACVTHGRYLTENLDRSKRQFTDAIIADIMANIELSNRLRGCQKVACGLVDVLKRYRKRSWADQKIAEIKAQMGLRGDGLVIGHGQFDPNIILVKRTSSDQRISELQALIALARRRGGVAVAHGKIDPLLIGRRKRDTQLSRQNFDSMRLRKLREAQSKFIQ